MGCLAYLFVNALLVLFCMGGARDRGRGGHRTHHVLLWDVGRHVL